MIKTYYLLTKPGIIIGNLITTISGFILASKGNFDPALFLATMVGISFMIASACVFNNYIDRHIDEKMERTKNRAFVKKLISVKSGIAFAIVLGISSTIVLSLYTNLLAVCMALTGFMVYVLLYSLLKSSTTLATLIGSISGALPPVIGYCAVSNSLDAGAIILFLILVLWQMPHFFSIAIYRLKDYTSAAIPVLPVKKGMLVTKIHMLLYIIAFTSACLMLTVFGYMGNSYLAVAALLGIAWLFLCIKGFKNLNDTLWARQMFVLSLVIITALSIFITASHINIAGKGNLATKITKNFTN